MEASSLDDAVARTLASTRGLLFGEPAIVHRYTYVGRNIIAPNDAFEPDKVDSRGYVPCEYWVASMTTAGNPIAKKGEGVTKMQLLGCDSVGLDELNVSHGALLFGEYGARWPLTKILDIGGKPVTTTLSSEPEVPPIPCHVHNGVVVDGVMRGPGKLEAYFYPPVDVPPYNLSLTGCVTRLGVKPTVDRDDMLAAMEEFGQNDRVYGLLNRFEVVPWEGWTIETGVVHAPGPYPTFEIQLPQDDFNLLAWQLGAPISDDERRRMEMQRSMLKGCCDCGDVMRQAVDWDKSCDPAFKEKWNRPAKVLESGDWGRRCRIFFDRFYGESYQVTPGATWRLSLRGSAAMCVPFGCLVWTGSGTVNGNAVSCMTPLAREFLVTPGSEFVVTAGGDGIIIFAVFPLDFEV